MEEKEIGPNTLVSYKGVQKDSAAIVKARWHQRGCACGEWHPEDTTEPLAGVENCEGRPGCFCGMWHAKGESGNKRGRLATLKPFATALQAALDTCVPDEHGIPVSRMQTIVMNLIKIASDPTPQRAEAAVRAILLLADRIDGKAAPSVEALENSGIRVVTINQTAITPLRSEPIKILQPTFIHTDEKDDDDV